MIKTRPRCVKTFTGLGRLLLDRRHALNSQEYATLRSSPPRRRYPLDIGLLGTRATR